MTKVKCKMCGSVSYSASEIVQCQCGGLCRRLPGNVINGTKKKSKSEKAEK